MNKYTATTGMLLIALIALLLPSCEYDQMPEPDNAICNVEQPTYDSHIKTIIDASCAYSGCHDGTGGAGKIYTNFEGTAADAATIRTRVLDLKDMPPSYASGPKKLTDFELDMIDCWLIAGTPEN